MPRGCLKTWFQGTDAYRLTSICRPLRSRRQNAEDMAVRFMAKAGVVETDESVILVEGESTKDLHPTDSLKIISVCPKNQGGENLLPVVCGAPPSEKQMKEPKP